MKNLNTYLFVSLFILFFNANTFGQYLETFSIPNKGAISGTNVSGSSTAACPANTLAACTNNDFTGTNWTITGNFTGFDSNDIMATNGSGVLFIDGDIDNEMCFESPLLDISTVSGSASLSVDVIWTHHDDAEYVDVEYQIDGGSWVTIPIQYGDNSGTGHTVDFSGSGNTGTGTVTHSGITGTTLKVRVCADSNTASNGESHAVDNVSVPEANVMVLPVELISFKTEKIKNEVELKWTTASELNNEKFEIEHSTNEMPFQKIGEIEGNLTTFQESNYSFTHERPIAGINYYRLKQIDLDGQFEYSDVISATVELKENNTSGFYPNPTEDGIVNLEYVSNNKTDMKISIFDTAGKNVFVKNIEIEKGENFLNFDFSSFEKGIYFVLLENSGNQEYRKLIIN